MTIGIVSAGNMPSYSAPLTPVTIETVPQIFNQYSIDGIGMAIATGMGWRGDRYWYRGHRGYRYYRPGYRYYNGAWFPLAAFGSGVIIGSAISRPAPAYRAGSAHVRWCYNRYRSYRAYDNTYQPNYGPRGQCISPY
jgi:BA14K-like protein